MKRTFTSFFVSALLVLICLTFVSCVDKGNNTGVNNSAPFGAKYPEKINAAHKINDGMDALQMYEAGVKNFYEASFTAARQLGDITTTSFLGEMSQKLDCFRIKQDGIYYLDSRSFTIKGAPPIKMCDQSVYKNGVYDVRSGEKFKISSSEGKMEVLSWGDTEHFGSLQSGLAVFPDDLTRINMFTVNKDTVKSSTKPIYDAKNKTYKFSMVMNGVNATNDYIPVMEYKTRKGGQKAKEITFTRLKFTVEMWDNGLIKKIDIEEAYDLVAELLNAKTKTTLFSTTYFTYDRAEVNINEYLFI